MFQICPGIKCVKRDKCLRANILLPDRSRGRTWDISHFYRNRVAREGNCSHFISVGYEVTHVSTTRAEPEASVLFAMGEGRSEADCFIL